MLVTECEMRVIGTRIKIRDGFSAILAAPGFQVSPTQARGIIAWT
jgi:hypothetical protein